VLLFRDQDSAGHVMHVGLQKPARAIWGTTAGDGEAPQAEHANGHKQPDLVPVGENITCDGMLPGGPLSQPAQPIVRPSSSSSPVRAVYTKCWDILGLFERHFVCVGRASETVTAAAHCAARESSMSEIETVNKKQHCSVA
jgi:hypothetical protein